MKRFLFTFLAALCAISANAQIIKTLGYNTNGQIVAATNVVWTNSFGFSTNTVAAQVRTNLLLGWSALTNTNAATSLLGFNTNGQVIANTGTNTLTFTNVDVGFGGDGFAISGNTISGPGNSLSFEDGAFTGTLYMDGGSIQFSGAANAAATRTNLGLPLNTLTNTSNVTLMRALSGSTNTNHPFSGSVSVVGTNNTNILVFSNGILQELQ